MDYLYIILAGMLSGFSSGMFGIGGSVIATPILSLAVGLPALLALASPLPAAIPSAISGSYCYFKNSLIEFKIALPALATAIPFALLGTYSTSFVNPEFLLIAKAVFLLILGSRFLATCRENDSASDSVSRTNIYFGLLSGIFAGYLSGILAVGGGIVLVTAFHRINRLPIKKAIATSLFCVGILALINSVAHFRLGNIDIETTLILAITVVPFSWLGARLAVSLKNKTLKKAFGIIMIIFALYFILFRLFTIY